MSKSRDLLIFNVFTALAAIHFLMKTKNTPLEAATWFYVMTWILSLVMLLWLRVYHGEAGDLVDYDENLERSHLPWLFGSIAAMMVICSLMVTSFTRSALYVPRPGAMLSQIPQSMEAVADDLLFNFVLVAPAEETMKLMGMLALYRRTGNQLLAVGLPVGIWSLLHAYYAYVGTLMPALVVSAFLSGVVLFLLLRYTRSLLNVQIAHGTYNSLVILSSLIVR